MGDISSSLWFWISFCRMRIISFINVWYNSTEKAYEPKIFFVEWFLTTSSFKLIQVSYFILNELDRFLSFNEIVHFIYFQVYWHTVAYDIYVFNIHTIWSVCDVGISILIPYFFRCLTSSFSSLVIFFCERTNFWFNCFDF